MQTCMITRWDGYRPKTRLSQFGYWQLSSYRPIDRLCKDMEVNAEQVGKVVWNVETCEAVNICQTWG
ncbi:hypothetical protein N7530_010827 [Penicillium desertorum]|uniref:Uncharacterized protein n=1 Tax=Penicillium desertorum TaxID=1303715 RepID=A0A9X0BGW3_9EURO|nr:hypothetical protein N7530_010827 [Penicillium desertorum]